MQQRQLCSKWLLCGTIKTWSSISCPKISWFHTQRLFLVGVRKRSSLCTTSTSNLGLPKRPYHNCGELSGTRHPSSDMGWIQLRSWCYPCARRGAHWTSINYILTYLLTYGAEPFLRSHPRTSQHFMEPEGSIPYSQEPSTGPYPEPYQSNPHHPILSL
jgi:hypothetical protein